jgi:hypothetical protein
MKKPAITVQYVLLADDVRTEINGKQIVIGLYNDTIVLLDGAKTLIAPLTFLMKARLAKGKAVHLATWIEGPDGTRLQESDFGEVGPPPEGDPEALIAWKIFPWKSEELGTYKLHMVQGGHDSVIYEFVIRN